MPNSNLLTIFALFLASLTIVSAVSPDLVVNVFRHGARGPTKSTYAQGWDKSLLGQLTPVGERMQYLLGASLAKQYPEILGQAFDRNHIYARTSQSGRCMESLESQLYGAYQGTGAGLGTNYPTDIAVPPFDPTLVNEVLAGLNNDQAIPGGFVPIIVNSVPESEDNVLETPTTCPSLFIDIIPNVFSEKSRVFWFDSLAETREILNAAGLKIETPLAMNDLGETLDCNYAQNMSFPANITYGSQLYKNVTFAGNWYSVLAQYNSTLQKQLLSVPLFAEVFQYLDAKATNSTPVEFVFLSTHDTALLTILASLDIVNADCLMDNYVADLNGQALPEPNCYYPPFASTILFEFYQNAGNPYVIFKYNDVAIPLCGESTECPYSDFKNLVKQATNGYTVEDYKLKCLNVLVDDTKNLIHDLKDLKKRFF